jgi:two-component system cell cycle response regulator
MNDARLVSVTPIGISGVEERRLLSAFQHSMTRNIGYTVTPLEDRPEILMVNADDPMSLVRWRKYREKLSQSNSPVPPSVVVSKNREFATEHYQVRHPLIASRVISVLDQVAIRELKSKYDVAFDIQKDSPDPGDSGIRKRQTVNRKDAHCAVLVVDDSLPVRIQMDQALRPFNAYVDFAETGEEALRLVANNHYDIVFLDVILPGMDGYETCRILREGRLKDTPVIMLTSNSSPADRVKGQLAGCDTYLIKPVGQTVFKEVVESFLSKTQRRQIASV